MFLVIKPYMNVSCAAVMFLQIFFKELVYIYLLLLEFIKTLKNRKLQVKHNNFGELLMQILKIGRNRKRTQSLRDL